jgi:hypothetical protein
MASNRLIFTDKCNKLQLRGKTYAILNLFSDIAFLYEKKRLSKKGENDARYMESVAWLCEMQ